MLAMILFAACELAVACCFAYSMVRFRQKSWQRTVALIVFLLGALAIPIGEPITYRMITAGKFLKMIRLRISPPLWGMLLLS